MTTLPVDLENAHVYCGAASEEKEEDCCDWYIDFFVWKSAEHPYLGPVRWFGGYLPRVSLL